MYYQHIKEQKTNYLAVSENNQGIDGLSNTIAISINKYLFLPLLTVKRKIL